MASIQKGTYYATVILEWNPPLTNDTTGYKVMVLSELSSSNLWTTDLDVPRTSLLLTIPYNTIYTISVAAMNCAGSSSPTMLDPFNVGQSYDYYSSPLLIRTGIRDDTNTGMNFI